MIREDADFALNEALSSCILIAHTVSDLPFAALIYHKETMVKTCQEGLSDGHGVCCIRQIRQTSVYLVQFNGPTSSCGPYPSATMVGLLV